VAAVALLTSGGAERARVEVATVFTNSLRFIVAPALGFTGTDDKD
jgi:hypothetical protein